MKKLSYTEEERQRGQNVPGLVVMGRDSCSKGSELESQRNILDGHFSHLFVVKNCNVCLKRPK